MEIVSKTFLAPNSFSTSHRNRHQMAWRSAVDRHEMFTPSAVFHEAFSTKYLTIRTTMLLSNDAHQWHDRSVFWIASQLFRSLTAVFAADSCIQMLMIDQWSSDQPDSKFFYYCLCNKIRSSIVSVFCRFSTIIFSFSTWGLLFGCLKVLFWAKYKVPLGAKSRSHILNAAGKPIVIF